MSESPGAALPQQPSQQPSQTQPPPLPPASSPKKPTASAGRIVGRVILRLLGAIYPLLLIIVILTLSGLAFWYLLDSLLFSPVNPPQVADLPALRETELSRSSSAFAGVRATENPRIPLAHYHRFGPWFQPDPFNDCTRSGCHGALPHYRRKESRAFLNLHATSLHCGVCHMASDGAQPALTWYDLTTGQTASPPAALRAMGWLDANERNPGGISAADQAAFVALLKEANRTVHARDMERLIEHVAAVRHDRPDLPALLRDARSVLQSHLRGEYGVKLALRSEAGGPVLAHPGSADATTAFVASRETLSGAAREQLLNQVHTRRAAQPRMCTDCHTTDRSAINFAKLGYPDARVRALTEPVLMSAIQKIMQGEEFHLPGFVGPQEEPDHR
jgi:hypothetical protein